MKIALAIFLGFLLDLLLGDPVIPHCPHPVVVMGSPGWKRACGSCSRPRTGGSWPPAVYWPPFCPLGRWP